MKNFNGKIFWCLAVIILLDIFMIAQARQAAARRVVFCDVGQGDGAFINLPGGRQIIVDGGPDNSLVGCVGKYLSYFDRAIDYVIISHPDKDHFVGALEILRRYRVGKIIVDGDPGDSEEYGEFLKAARGRLIMASAGDDIKIGGAELKFFSPEADKQYKDSNEKSLVFKFIYHGRSILFTGDLPDTIENNLIKQNADLTADILKVGHHGSKTSSSQNFLDAVAPKLAVISVGADNRFGHPAYIILKRLENLGAKILRTDQSGDVVVNLD